MIPHWIPDISTCECHGVEPNRCPVWVAFHGAMVYATSDMPHTMQNIFGQIQAGVLALTGAGLVVDTILQQRHQRLIATLAQGHRPATRPALMGAGWVQMRCVACDTNWRTIAPGEVPYRCDVWQTCLEEGIVSE